MDYSGRAGSKKGAGGMASAESEGIKRKDQVKRLKKEIIDARQDPYLSRSPNGKLTCKACNSVHPNEAAYFAHINSKRHRDNALRTQSTDSRLKPEQQPAYLPLPRHRVVKIRDPSTHAPGVALKIAYPDISTGIVPRFRFMNAFEQEIEKPRACDQYLVIVAEPYESVAIKLPARPIDTESLISHFCVESGDYVLQFLWPAASIAAVEKEPPASKLS